MISFYFPFYCYKRDKNKQIITQMRTHHLITTSTFTSKLQKWPFLNIFFTFRVYVFDGILGSDKVDGQIHVQTSLSTTPKKKLEFFFGKEMF